MHCVAHVSTRNHTKGLDSLQICLKHFCFSWNVSYIEEPENAQPYQCLKLSNSSKNGKYLTTKETWPRDDASWKLSAVTCPPGKYRREMVTSRQVFSALTLLQSKFWTCIHPHRRIEWSCAIVIIPCCLMNGDQWHSVFQDPISLCPDLLQESFSHADHSRNTKSMHHDWSPCVHGAPFNWRKLHFFVSLQEALKCLFARSNSSFQSNSAFLFGFLLKRTSLSPDLSFFCFGQEKRKENVPGPPDFSEFRYHTVYVVKGV